MAIPFYYNPATNELELTADPSPLRESLGTRFGLNEISTRAKTLSPTKSHTAESVMPSQFDEISLEEMEDIKKQAGVGEQVKKDPYPWEKPQPPWWEDVHEPAPWDAKDGGRIDMKPGGIVEPGVTHYATSPKKTGKFKYKVVNQFGTFWSDKPGVRGDVESFRKFIKKFKGKEIYKGFVLDQANKFGINRGTANRVIDEIRPDIKELPYPETKVAKRKRLVVEKRLKKNFLDNPEFIKLHKNFEGSDLKFAEFLNEKGFTSERGGNFTESAVYSRREQLKLKTKTLPQSMSSYKTEAKALGIDIKGLDDQTIKNKVRDKRGGEIKKIKRLNPDFAAKMAAVQKAWQKANPEKVKEARFKGRLKAYEKFGMIQPVKNAKEELWRSLFEDGKKYKKGRRLKIVGDYGRYVPREKFLNAKILDTKTGKTITFKNLENYINPKNTGKTYAQVIKPFDQKWFVNETPGLRTEINSKLIPNWTAASKDTFFEIQHNAGRYNDPFDVSLSNESLNLKESQVRTKFEKMWNASDNLSDKKKAFSFYKENLPNEILSKPSMVKRPRYFGTEVPFEEQLREVKAKGVELPRGTLKKAREIQNLLRIAKNAKGPPRIKAIQLLVGAGVSLGLLNEFGISSAEAAEAKTLEPGDKKQEASVIGDVAKGAGAIALGTAVVHPKETGELAKKVLTKAGKILAKPIALTALPGTQIIPETYKAIKEKRLPDYNLTDPLTWVNAGFWDWAVKTWGWDKTVKNFGESLKTLSTGDKARVVRNVVARAGLSPKAVQFISSRVAWPVAGIMSVHDAYKDYQERKEFLTPERIAEAQEEEFDKKEPMFAMGGIASLLK